VTVHLILATAWCTALGFVQHGNSYYRLTVIVF